MKTATQSFTPDGLISHLEAVIDGLHNIGGGVGEPVTPPVNKKNGKAVVASQDIDFNPTTLTTRIDLLESRVEAIAEALKIEALKSEPEAEVGAGIGVPRVRRAKAPAIRMQGQDGPTLEVAWDALNPKEREVLRALNGEGRGPRKQRTLEELAAECFGDLIDNESQANSWVRNSLRRLVRGQWVEKTSPGNYRISDGRRPQVKRRPKNNKAAILAAE